MYVPISGPAHLLPPWIASPLTHSPYVHLIPPYVFPTLPPIADLGSNPAFNGLNIPKNADGTIDPAQQLFRTDYPGVTNGENKHIMDPPRTELEFGLPPENCK